MVFPSKPQVLKEPPIDIGPNREKETVKVPPSFLYRVIYHSKTLSLYKKQIVYKHHKQKQNEEKCISTMNYEIHTAYDLDARGKQFCLPSEVI